jgi:hypothetical protein
VKDPAAKFAAPRIASGALFVNGNRVLLVHETYGNAWDVPGGYAAASGNFRALTGDACPRGVPSVLVVLPLISTTVPAPDSPRQPPACKSTTEFADPAVLV